MTIKLQYLLQLSIKAFSVILAVEKAERISTPKYAVGELEMS